MRTLRGSQGNKTPEAGGSLDSERGPIRICSSRLLPGEGLFLLGRLRSLYLLCGSFTTRAELSTPNGSSHQMCASRKFLVMPRSKSVLPRRNCEAKLLLSEDRGSGALSCPAAVLPSLG